MAASSTAMPKGAFQPDTDVHITFEDQQKINKFARQNARLDDLKEELKMKQKDLTNLEDASDELILQDGDENIPFMLGEVFVCQTMEATQDMLDDKKKQLKEDIGSLNTQCEGIKQVMADLKVQLYAKFGTNINLEAEEE